MSPHIACHGEDGEEHELDSAGDAGGDRCPADEIAEMEKEGYDKDFSIALSAASSLQSPLIPPSTTVMVYDGGQRHVDEHWQEAEQQRAAGSGDEIFQPRGEEQDRTDCGEDREQRENRKQDLKPAEIKGQRRERPEEGEHLR